MRKGQPVGAIAKVWVGIVGVSYCYINYLQPSCYPIGKATAVFDQPSQLGLYREGSDAA